MILLLPPPSAGSFLCYSSCSTVSGEDDASSCFWLRKSIHDFLGVLMWPPLLQERFSLVAVDNIVKWGLEGPDLFVDCVTTHQPLHCASGKYFRMISWWVFFRLYHQLMYFITILNYFLFDSLDSFFCFKCANFKGTFFLMHLTSTQYIDAAEIATSLSRGTPCSPAEQHSRKWASSLI